MIATPPPPTPLEQAATAVQHIAQHQPGARNTRLGWAILRYVHRTVSPVRYQRLAAKPTTVNAYLTTRAGLCAGQIATALAIADHLHLDARPVELYYRDRNGPQSHIMLEINAAGRWRLFDVTWASVYRTRTGRLMSWRTLQRVPAKRRLAHKHTVAPDPWLGYYRRRHQLSEERRAYAAAFHYVTHRGDTVVDGRGTIHLPRHGSAWRPVPNVPDYIGSTQTYGVRRSHLRVQLDRTRPGSTVTVTFTYSGCAHATLVARSGRTVTTPVTPDTRTVTVPAGGRTLTLSVRGDCYLKLTGATTG